MLKIISNEDERFLREIEIDAGNTFYQLHEIIQNSCGFDPSQLASFFLADEEWDKGSEISQLESYTNTISEPQEYLMHNIKLKQFIQNKNDKLIYNFDVFSDRFLFLELKNIIMEKSKNAGVVTLSKGEAPNQLLEREVNELDLPVGTDLGELDDMNEIYGDIDEIL